jgi:invasion protein IalB
MYSKRVKGERGLGMKAGLAALIMAAGIGLATVPALAQSAAPAAKGAAPAAAAKGAAPAASAKGAAPAQDDKDKNYWIKLCDKVPGLVEPKEGEKEPQKIEQKICLTHLEQIDPRNGMPLVSVAIRHIDGKDKEALMIMVPLHVILPPGVLVKLEDNDGKSEGEPLKIPFVYCAITGCVAEVEATKDLIEKMKKSKAIGIGVVNMSGKGIKFALPMQGFEKTLAGPPADNNKYKEDRKRLWAAIQERQKKAKEEADAAAGGKEGGAAKAPPANPKQK